MLRKIGLQLLAGVACLAPTSLTVSADPPPPGRVVVEVVGLASNKGQVAFALYDSPDRYEARETPVRAGVVPLENRSCSIVFDGLVDGEYALMLYHDRNANGRLDRRAFGAPTEPYGFSNDARGRFGPPSFEEARFTVAGPVMLQVRLK